MTKTITTRVVVNGKEVVDKPAESTVNDVTFRAPPNEPTTQVVNGKTVRVKPTPPAESNVNGVTYRVG